MVAALRRMGLLAFAIAVLGGCTVDAFTYTIDRYGTATSRQIHLGCNNTYEIYDRPRSGTMLVLTNALNEALASSCRGEVEALPKPERMRRVAKIFLAETTDRPECRVTRETPMTDFHTEFAYTCSGSAPRPVAGAKPKRR